ncbi:MAG: hypothetical protein E6J23_02780, partial [Chloroflexi bacterium]
MSSFLVTRERGPAWDDSRSMTEQVAWLEHAAFMNLLVDEGFVVLGGPVGEGKRVLLVVSADSEAAIRRRIEADPWTPLRLLPIATIEAWRVLLGSPGRRQAAS